MPHTTKLICIALLAASCAGPQQASTANGESPQAAVTDKTSADPFKVHYRDLPGNVYKFWKVEGVVRYEYRPMSPEMSSSGLYSGGSPSKGALNADQVKTLRAHLEALVENKAARGAFGRKGNATLSIAIGSAKESFAVVGEAVAELNKFLFTIRAKK